jgi:hypothetical protein
MMPQLYDMGIQLTRQRALSAMPDAPVVPDARTGNPRLRRATARALRRMADRMEPIT